ncbi:MAG: hypothetical protein ACOZDD_10500 [Bacteroidota bacterium]
MVRYFYQILITIFVFVAVIACEDEKYLNSPDAQLRFSADTIMFDTVFSTIGSTTRLLKIFNPYHEKVMISRIKVGSGELSSFRLNINGLVGNEAYEVEIPPNDSIFIFVEVTVDPTGQSLPMVVKDSIEFTINFNRQAVQLIAWGQDFHLIRKWNLRTTTWGNDKPYLVYDYAFVDSLNTLTIEPGARVHFHKGAGLYVRGNIVANGTKDNPILFTSDRLEEAYKNLPDQWNGILIFSGSKNNQLDYVNIKNANIGLQVGTLEHEGTASVKIANTRIENMAYAGIFALKSKITAYNTVVANCGFYATALLVGGEYEFYHTTIANYWGGFSAKPRKTSSLTISNLVKFAKADGSENVFTGDLKKAHFGNCIIYGNNPLELELGFQPDNQFNYYFDHCIIQLPDTFNISDRNRYNNVWKGKDFVPKFKDPYKNLDFQLDTLSPAKDRGSAVYSRLFPFDMKGMDRTLDDGPDLGAFERIEKKPQK